MAERVVIEIDGFLAFCSTQENGDKWRPFVQFERKADHRNTLVDSKSHYVKADFDTERDAFDAAFEYAHQCVKVNGTGF
jgi:hypothetical protein